MDVKRAADLYAQGWTLRQIGAELGLTATTVSQQLKSAGVTMRRGARAHPASTQKILELRDQGLSWPEIAEQVDTTVSGAWSRYRKARPPKSPRFGRWQQVSPTPWTTTLRLAYERLSLIISAARRPGLNSLLLDGPPTVSPPSVVPAYCMCPVRMWTPTQAIAPIWCWRSRM